MKAPRRAFLGALATAPLFPKGKVSAEAQSQAAPSEGASMSDGLLVAARARFGRYLSAEEAEEVKKGIASVVRSGEKLRAVALSNADEPVGTFEARPRPRGRRER
jgi:hypothetical protein